MRSVLLLATVMIGSACRDSDSSDTPPDRAACERYRDHILDVRLEGVVEDREAHRAALAASLGTDIVTQCLELDRAEVECATKAKTLAATRACGER
jgi:hypothetical protein